MHNFPHREQDYFNYAYIRTYREYYAAYTWCRTNAKKFWQVNGDPETHIYQFAFMDTREYTMFILTHSNVIICTSTSKDTIE